MGMMEPDSVCCICYGNYEQDDQIVQLPCDSRHIFHYECIDRWLQTRQVCPICKAEIQIPGLMAGQEIPLHD